MLQRVRRHTRWRLLFSVLVLGPMLFFVPGLVASTPPAAAQPPTGFGTLQSISCPTVSYCVAVGSTGIDNSGSDFITATFDGGNSWTNAAVPATTPGGEQGFIAVFCLPNTTDCWAVDFDDNVMSTTDGSTWTIISQPGQQFTDITCSNTSDCWATYYAGGTWGSTDGGVTWTEHSGNAGNFVTCIENTTDCWAAGTTGGGGGSIEATTDGTTWNYQTLPAGVLELYGISCVNTSDCWAVGSGPAILVTTDGGTTWTSQQSGGSSFGPGRITCLDTSTCWAVGFVNAGGQPNEAGIEVTTDGGNTWTAKQVPSGVSGYPLSAVSCLSDTDCWVVGRSGSGASIINYALSSGGTASSGSFGVTVTGTGGTDGVDSVSEAEYVGDPVGNLTDGNNYFDVAASTGNTFSSVVIQDCNDVTTSTSLDWWDPSANAGSGGWGSVVGDPGPTYEPGRLPCMTVTLDGLSSPTPSQLAGTILGTTAASVPPPPSGSLRITTSQLLAGAVRTHYSATLAATGGDPPYTWKLSAGSSKLPRGLRLSRSTGVISGVPKRAGTSFFKVEVLDKKIRTRHHHATQNTATKVLSITIS